MKHAMNSIAVLVALAAPHVAGATTVFPQEFSCPVGGEKFEDYVVGSTSSWGQRPDGKSIGGVAPWPVVECPQNGFPIYQDEFTQAELDDLARAIATPEFGALREQDTTYRRIWWLRERMGADPYSLVSNLLSASWESDDDRERKLRYQLDFAHAAEALERTEEHADDWFWFGLRAANAYREAGRFDDAERMLAAVNREEFYPQDSEQREGARMLVGGLAPLIAERNRASEPANLVGPENAVERCREMPADLTAVERTACASAPYREAIAQRLAAASDAEAAARSVGEAAMDAAAAMAAVDAAAADAEANMDVIAESVDD